MSRIVFVHGIAQQTKNPDRLEAAWLDALNEGLAEVAAAGTATPVGASDVSMAYWAALFGAGEGAQGDPAEMDVEDWDPATREVAEELAKEWLAHAAAADETELATGGSDALATLEGLQDPGEPQGPLEVVRKGLDLLGRLRFTSKVAFPITAGLMRRSLYQVAAYLADDDIREKCLEIVEDEIDEFTEIVVSHSLGSVIAFEACHRLDRGLPLLVTLGSPLGLKTVVYDKLRPAPPTYPAQVDHWVNVADRDDIVAARLQLQDLFPGDADAGRLVDHEATIRKFWAHGIAGYLTQATVAYPIRDVLTTTS